MAWRRFSTGRFEARFLRLGPAWDPPPPENRTGGPPRGAAVPSRRGRGSPRTPAAPAGVERQPKQAIADQKRPRPRREWFKTRRGRFAESVPAEGRASTDNRSLDGHCRLSSFIAACRKRRQTAQQTAPAPHVRAAIRYRPRKSGPFSSHPILRVRFLTPRSPTGASRRRPAQLGELPFPPIYAFSRNVESGDRATVPEG